MSKHTTEELLAIIDQIRSYAANAHAAATDDECITRDEILADLEQIVDMAALGDPDQTATRDLLTRALLVLPGATFHPTVCGRGSAVMLVSTDRYVFQIGRDGMAIPPTQQDASVQISVYPRFGRTDPVAIYTDSQYTVPTFTVPASDGAAAIHARLLAYEMPLVERMQVIRACGDYQTATFGDTGRYPEHAVIFEHDGVGICDPFTDEGGMREVNPDTYYGDAFRASAFFR